MPRTESAPWNCQTYSAAPYEPPAKALRGGWIPEGKRAAIVLERRDPTGAVVGEIVLAGGFRQLLKAQFRLASFRELYPAAKLVIVD